MRMLWTSDNQVKLKKLWPGATKEELLKEFKFSSWRGITSAALGYKCPARPHKLGHNAILTYSKDFFSIWSEASAYILGFLEADSWFKLIGKRSAMIKIALSIKDREHLELLRDILGSNAKIGTWFNKNKKTSSLTEACRFTINAPYWKDFLIGHLRINSIPKDIPIELLHHYIRGYFDGDGSIFYEKQSKCYKSNFVFSSKDLATEFAGMLRPVLGSKLITHAKSSSRHCWYFNISYGATVKLGQFLYNNSKIFLLRKKELFNKMSDPN
jgi:intein/homing endonuclease